MNPFEEAQFGDGVPVTLIGSNHPVGVLVGLRSGAVRFKPATIDPEVWQRLLDGSADALP